MAAALTAPLIAAGLVLCVAGLAKLRSPAGAARALTVLGLPGRAGLVRAFAAAEVALGAACVLEPSAATAGAAACVYAMFAAVALVLARRRAACGCFGDGDAPATVPQAVLSALLALVALAAASWPPHGIDWVLAHPASFAAVFLIGTAGSVYGIVLAYTELPQAWSSWSGA